ncbi:unnamed protein product [Urochloa decumbens]|uniref:Peroxidase n=1 Tax=Urochloa decumbens TaxID=240449 RepID=A0ABC9AWP9_9POAL
MYLPLRTDSTLAPGLIRLYFNDCFPNSCDASIFLTWPNTPECLYEPNKYILTGSAWDLIESLRRSVHAECGATVSCADILVVAAREAVKFVGGTINFPMPLGRLDGLAPATSLEVSSIPSARTQQASVMLAKFASRGFDHPAELVLFLGAHSIGRAHCESFKDRADRQNDDFSRKLFWHCQNDKTWLQPLDYITPDRLDTSYYANVLAGEGVLTSDMALGSDPRTRSWVEFYMNNPDNFADDFSILMGRLFTVRGGARRGEIRKYGCFKINAVGPGAGIPGVVSSSEQEGAAASSA